MADQSPNGETADLHRLRLSESSPLIEALGQFLRDLDLVHSTWLNSMNELVDCHEHLFRSRSRVKELVDRGTVPPPGQTGTQFGAGLLNLIEEGWHLCRFVRSLPPNAKFTDADDRRLLANMHERLPAIHDELRTALLHLKHVASLEADGNEFPASESRMPAPKAEATEHARNASNEGRMTSTLEAVRGVYDWAMSQIPGADAMTIPKLFVAIQQHPEMQSEFLERLPDNADTFGAYLRRAGIRRYNTSGNRARRSSRRPRT